MTANYNPEELLHKLKSEIEPDEQFKQGLRHRLLTMASLTKEKKGQKNMTDIIKKTIISLAAVAAIAVLIVTESGTFNTNKVAARQGFGLLPGLQQGGLGGAGNAPAPTATTMEGTASRGEAQDSSIGSGGGNSFVAPDRDFIPPRITYSLETDLPEIPEEILVLRDNPLRAGAGIANYLREITGLGFLSGFGNANLENLSLRMANSPYGINLEQFGRFNIWRNQTGEYREIRAEDMPPNEQLVTIAEQFLQEFGIDSSAYGQPYVDESWKNYPRPIPFDPAVSAERLIAPAPSYAQVYYPMEINGLPVVGWGGDIDPGLMVSVDILRRQGSGIAGRWNTDRQQSLYPARSQEEIEREALSGGLNPLWGWHDAPLTAEQEAQRPVWTVRFTSARLGYIQQYKYDSSSGTSQSYWIPVIALLGSYVDEAGNENKFGTIVPAVQGDFFEQPSFRVMPAEAGGGASSGQSEATLPPSIEVDLPRAEIMPVQ